MELKLSQRLRICAQELESADIENLSQEEQQNIESARDYVRTVAKCIVGVRERLLPNSLPELHPMLYGTSNTVEHMLDELYSLELLDEVSSMVEKTLELFNLNAEYLPSQQVNRYIAEATRAYVKDLPLASVAMSRSALEQGLREYFGIKSGEKAFLKTLINRAALEGLFEKKLAETIADKCNEAVHDHPLTSDDALAVFLATRSLLVRIYSVEKPPLPPCV